ncbi:MAG: ribonuclease HII [Clostridia bacterium]|nr:ribonuclease HII [Clostridia bacterium]
MFDYENKFLGKGYKFIAGVDEAGRGPLAGPVVVASVVMPLDEQNIIDGVNDSKKLSPKKRDMLYDQIIAKAKAYSVSIIDHKTIDRINILEATKQGMCQCINNLSVSPDIVLVDAVKGLDVNFETLPIIHGDALSYSIACASIIAKVTRDRLMLEYDKQYPQYNFAKHKGYGTTEHIKLLKEFGKCPIHRDSFIKNFVGEK